MCFYTSLVILLQKLHVLYLITPMLIGAAVHCTLK